MKAPTAPRITKQSLSFIAPLRRGGRVVDGSGLENSKIVVFQRLTVAFCYMFCVERQGLRNDVVAELEGKLEGAESNTEVKDATIS